MTDDESLLRAKLRRIEALFAGAGTDGERAAAGAAAARIRAKLATMEREDRPVELRFTVPDPWAQRLFVALCRRYGLRPFRRSRMHRQSFLVRGPRAFLEDVLWAEFQELNDALAQYLAAVTDKIIREEVYGEIDDAEEEREPQGRRSPGR